MFIVSNIVCEKTSESDMDLNFTSGTWNLYILGWIISIMRLTSLIYKMSMVMPGWESVSHSAMSDSFQPMDCSLPGFSVHGISQARILEWVAICFSWGSSQTRDQTWISHIARRFFTIWVTMGSPWDDTYAKTHLTQIFNILAALKRQWKDGLKMEHTHSRLQVMSQKCP